MFQGYPQDSTAPLSYYTEIGVPTWASKAEIVAKYGELKRAARRHSGVYLGTLEPYEVLSDASKLSEYDESIGVAEKRRSRIDLRPLGFFSKSLSKAQQSWPTWEREILIVLLALVHFRIIVTGMVVVIHTDHLNNTVLGENLTRPDKILIMLLKTEGLVKPQWKFSPGNAQIGDGFSRNPEDRHEVRGESEGTARMLRILAEAFAVSTGTTLEGNLLTDGAEVFTQHFENRINATSHRSDGADLELEEPELMKELRLLGRSEPGAYHAARTTKTGGNVSAVMFPRRIGDLRS